MDNKNIKQIYGVEPIERINYYEWLLYKHYAKRIPSVSYAFGLFKNHEQLGVLTIGKPASNQLCIGICGEDFKDYVYELNRLCVVDGLERNVLSYFVSKTLRMISDSMILVSYADTIMGHHGYIYQATNWLYTGATKERTDINTGDNKHSRHYEKNIDYTNRKFRSSKHRYCYFLGRKKDIFRKNLKYQIFPYPKGINSRYDSSRPLNTQTILFQ